MSGDFKWIPLNKLVSPKRDIRTNRSELFIKKLMNDIRNGRIIDPLIVRILPNEKYEVLDGETRHIALERLKWKKAPCMIYNVPDVEALLIQCKMAILKRSYDPIGLAHLIKYLNKTKKMTLMSIAKELGYKHRSFVSKLHALNKLSDEDKERVSKGELSIEMGYSIASNRPYSRFEDKDRPKLKKQCDICEQYLSEEEIFKIRICPLCFEALKQKAKKRLEEPQQTQLS